MRKIQTLQRFFQCEKDFYWFQDCVLLPIQKSKFVCCHFGFGFFCKWISKCDLKKNKNVVKSCRFGMELDTNWFNFFCFFIITYFRICSHFFLQITNPLINYRFLQNVNICAISKWDISINNGDIRAVKFNNHVKCQLV